jgi:hypothetical protein
MRFCGAQYIPLYERPGCLSENSSVACAVVLWAWAGSAAFVLSRMWSDQLASSAGAADQAAVLDGLVPLVRR